MVLLCLGDHLFRGKPISPVKELAGMAALSNGHSVSAVNRIGSAELKGFGTIAGKRRKEHPRLIDVSLIIEKPDEATARAKLHVDGEPFPLPAAIDLSAYRIVQEGLTNALKHAHASHADVTVCYGSDSLRTEVRDDGIGATASDGLGTSHGHGLVGIRERVKIYGGEMTAGAANGRGFVLSARLPLGGDRA